MKKIIAFILLLCIAMAFTACGDNKTTAPENTQTENNIPEVTPPENTTPDITLQEVFEAGKTLGALLGDHENVYIQAISDGEVLWEEYLSNQYSYAYYSNEYTDWGFDSWSFATDNAMYYFVDEYGLELTISPNGMVPTTDIIDLVKSSIMISSVMMDTEATITEENGSFIVSCVADLDEIYIEGDVVSCVETYTIDATTREMTAIETVYTYADGTVDGGIITITRDVEMPENMIPFITYAEETENMHTVTIVSNPGTEDEKTETIQVPKGLQVSLYPDWEIEETFTLYADADCTQPIEEELDVNSDLTIYVKWGE